MPTEQAIIALRGAIDRARHRKTGQLFDNAPQLIAEYLAEAGYGIVHVPTEPVGDWIERIQSHQHGTHGGHRVWVFREFCSYSPGVEEFCDLIMRAAEGLERAFFTVEVDDVGDEDYGVQGMRVATAEDKTEVDRQRERTEAMEREQLAHLYGKYGPPPEAAGG